MSNPRLADLLPCGIADVSLCSFHLGDSLGRVLDSSRGPRSRSDVVGAVLCAHGFLFPHQQLPFATERDNPEFERSLAVQIPCSLKLAVLMLATSKSAAVSMPPSLDLHRRADVLAPGFLVQDCVNSGQELIFPKNWKGKMTFLLFVIRRNNESIVSLASRVKHYKFRCLTETLVGVLQHGLRNMNG